MRIMVPKRFRVLVIMVYVMVSNDEIELPRNHLGEEGRGVLCAGTDKSIPIALARIYVFNLRVEVFIHDFER